MFQYCTEHVSPVEDVFSGLSSLVQVSCRTTGTQRGSHSAESRQIVSHRNIRTGIVLPWGALRCRECASLEYRHRVQVCDSKRILSFSDQKFRKHNVIGADYRHSGTGLARSLQRWATVSTCLQESRTCCGAESLSKCRVQLLECDCEEELGMKERECLGLMTTRFSTILMDHLQSQPRRPCLGWRPEEECRVYELVLPSLRDPCRFSLRCDGRSGGGSWWK